MKKELVEKNLTSDKYPHSILQIGDKIFYDSLKDNLNINGGCGLKLTNMIP